MKRDELQRQLSSGLEPVGVTPQLRRRTLDLLEGKEQMIVKRKWTVALALALLMALLVAVAVAAAHRAGLLDFIGRYSNSFVPEDAHTYVQTDVAGAENGLVTATVREAYYDGRVSRIVMDVAPKADGILLLGEDMYPDDPWENMLLEKHPEGECDLRPVWQVYQELGYTGAYSASFILRHPEGRPGGTMGSMDYYLGEDGVLTIYQQEEYEAAPDVLNVTVEVLLLPWDTPLTADSSPLSEQRTTLSFPLTLKKPEDAGEVWVSSGTADFPSAGVRVEGLMIEVKPQEIFATLDFTVTDRAAYDALEHGLWFEFIDPDSSAESFYDQRLMSGLTGGASIGPMDTDDLATAVHYRQSETLGRNELHESYTIRAYNTWEKERYETVTLSMHPATEEEAEAFRNRWGETDGVSLDQGEEFPADEEEGGNNG